MQQGSNIKNKGRHLSSENRKVRFFENAYKRVTMHTLKAIPKIRAEESIDRSAFLLDKTFCSAIFLDTVNGRPAVKVADKKKTESAIW